MAIDKKAFKNLPLTEQGEIANLLKTGKLCQDILQLYRIFERGMHQMERTSDMLSINLPPSVNRDSLSSTFVKIIADPRISPEKVLHFLSSLLADAASNALSFELIQTKILVLSLMRDAVKELSPTRVYKSIQHRDDIYFAIIEALEELEDEAEDLENEVTDNEEEVIS